jgi:hypothetical protein
MVIAGEMIGRVVVLAAGVAADRRMGRTANGACPLVPATGRAVNVEPLAHGEGQHVVGQHENERETMFATCHTFNPA